MKKTFLLIIFASIFASCQMPKDDWIEIQMILGRQSEAWNRGDLEGFMDGYWNSPELKFVGKDGITKGWQENLDRYKKSYPDKEAMGGLTFNILEHEPVGAEHFQVIGRWRLIRESDTLEGCFTLLWEKDFNGKWYIISDHSS